MNLPIDKNIQIAEKYCLNPDGCPKLRGLSDYNEKLSKCAGCTNYLNKIDLVEILQYYKNNTPTSHSHTSTYKGKGKSTELSRTQIKRVLELKDEGYSIHKIALELKLQDRTVKNVLTLGFKNDRANKKVREVREVMQDLET